MIFIQMLFAAVPLSQSGAAAFPPEMTRFEAYEGNPVFTGAGPGHWDEDIRERGWILFEDNTYHLWYTGYAGTGDSTKALGYATSRDGLTWTRYAGNPIYCGSWVEDMTVIHQDGTYYMFAEGENDRAQLLTSPDRIHWTRHGVLDIRTVNGEPIGPGPFGTPAVIFENGVWYLFYERNDEAVWLAKSTDLRVWTHVQDGPVLEPGPAASDRGMIAVDQVVRYKGRYYAYYHGLTPHTKPQLWTTSIAASDDMVHWEKYPGNPIVATNHSSAELLLTGGQIRLYTMHPDVCLFQSEPRAIGTPRCMPCGGQRKIPIRG